MDKTRIVGAWIVQIQRQRIRRARERLDLNTRQSTDDLEVVKVSLSLSLAFSFDFWLLVVENQLDRHVFVRLGGRIIERHLASEPWRAYDTRQDGGGGGRRGNDGQTGRSHGGGQTVGEQRGQGTEDGWASGGARGGGGEGEGQLWAGARGLRFFSNRGCNEWAGMEKMESGAQVEMMRAGLRRGTWEGREETGTRAGLDPGEGERRRLGGAGGR